MMNTRENNQLQGWYRKHFETVDSTMLAARTALDDPEFSSPALFTASEQTAGRGRQGRIWSSGSGNIAATFVFSTKAGIAQLSGLSLAVGLVLVDSLTQSVEPTQLKVKWPNDIVTTDGKKLAGILIELLPRGEKTVALIGIGLNVAEAPHGIDGAVALRELVREDTPAAEQILMTLARNLETAWKRFETGGFAAFAPAWRERGFGLGSEVTIDCGAESISGIFSDVDVSGALLLDVQGQKRIISSGSMTVRIA